MSDETFTKENCVVLPEDLTIRSVADLHTNLQAYARASSELTFDGQDVMNVDCAGLQLLIAVIREAKASDAKIIWTDVSEKLSEVASTLGLNSDLELAQ